MKKNVLVAGLSGLAIAALVGFKIAATSLAIGDAMPMADSKVTDINGKEIKLADAKKANGLLVMFSSQYLPLRGKEPGTYTGYLPVCTSK